MFGMFGATKIKTLAFVETTYVLRKHTNIDLDKMTIDERGEIGDNTYEKLKQYEAKSKYRNIELVCACWGELIMKAEFCEADHFLYGKKIILLKGLADYLLSDNVTWGYENYGRGKHFPAYFTASIIEPLNEIPDGKSWAGISVSKVFEHSSN